MKVRDHQSYYNLSSGDLEYLHIFNGNAANSQSKPKCQPHGGARGENQGINKVSKILAGDPECLYKVSWQSIQQLMRYFSLDQKVDQPSDQQTGVANHRAMHGKECIAFYVKANSWRSRDLNLWKLTCLQFPASKVQLKFTQKIKSGSNQIMLAKPLKDSSYCRCMCA